MFCVAEVSNSDGLCQHYNSTEHHILAQSYYVTNSFKYLKSYYGAYIFRCEHPDKFTLNIIIATNLGSVGLGMAGTM